MFDGEDEWQMRAMEGKGREGRARPSKVSDGLLLADSALTLALHR